MVSSSSKYVFFVAVTTLLRPSAVIYQAIFVPLGACYLGQLSYTEQSPREANPALAAACNLVCRQARS